MTNKLEEKYLRWRKTDAAEYVMGLFRRLALERASLGLRFGMKALAERVRWESALAGTPGGAGAKLDNVFVPYIGRELVQELPVLKGFVEFRKTRAERAPFPEQWLGRVKSPRRIPTSRRAA